MKIRKIIDFCKKSGRAVLYNAGEQWLSDGFAIYPLFELPEFDEDTLFKTYDITKKQADKIRFDYENGLPKNIDFSDFSTGEMRVERGSMSFSYAGHYILPIITSRGVEFIDEKYLQPLSDIEDSVLELYERRSEDGKTYFVAKSGFMLVGVILPMDVVNAQFVESLSELSEQCKIAFAHKKNLDSDNSQMTFSKE